MILLLLIAWVNVIQVRINMFNLTSLGQLYGNLIEDSFLETFVFVLRLSLIMSRAETRKMTIDFLVCVYDCIQFLWPY